MRVSDGSGMRECLVGVACESVWWEWHVRVSDGSGT